jgi:hypothetical protein
MSRVHLRVRRSTALLTLVFLATLVLYLNVRPPPPTQTRYGRVQSAPTTTGPESPPSTSSPEHP